MMDKITQKLSHGARQVAMMGAIALGAAISFRLGILAVAAPAAGVVLLVRKGRHRSGRGVRKFEAVADLEQLLALDPYGFEFAVRDILLACGFVSLRQVGGSGDLGADLIGTDPWGERVIVQCKRFSPDHKVGSPELQRFLGAMQIHQAQRGVVVTTSSYSQQAIDVAFRHNVDLIDGPKLAAMAASGQLGVST